MMAIGGWQINWDALLARIVYRWSGRTLLGMLLLCAVAAIASGAVPPVWRGEAQLELTGPPLARLEVDGKPWPHTLYAGSHIATATLPDGRGSSVEFGLARGERASVALPAGLGHPRVRQLTANGPDSTVVRAGFAGGTWRLQSTHGDDPEAGVQTVALDSDGLEPISLLDAYGGLADVLRVGDQEYRALYQPKTDRAGGSLEVHGWNGGIQTFVVSGTLTLVRWSPDAQALLVAERLRSNGEELRIFRPGAEPEPVLAVPGRVSDILWHPAGHAAALLSRHRDRLTLTAVRLRPTTATRVLAELVVPQASTDANGEPAIEPAAVVPLTWSKAAIEWLAPDERGTSILWRAPLATLLPENAGALEAAAIFRTVDGALRSVRPSGGRLAIGQQQSLHFVVEAWIPDISATSGLAGIWAPDGASLMLRSGSTTWLVDVYGSSGEG